MLNNTIKSRISGVPRTAPLIQNTPMTQNDNSYNADYDDYTDYVNADNKFQKLKKEQEAIENYKKRLFEIHKYLNIRKGKTLATGMKEAYNEVDTILENEFIIHPKIIDPLVSVYEKKCEILEREIRESNSDVNKLSQIINVLVDDNTKLRELLTRKETDIQQLIAEHQKHKQTQEDSYASEILLLKQHIEDLQADIENYKFKETTGQLNSKHFGKEKEELINLCERYRIELETEKKLKRGLVEEKIQIETSLKDAREKIIAEDSEILDLKQRLEEITAHNKSLSDEKETLERLVNDNIDRDNIDVDYNESIKKVKAALDEQTKNVEMLKAENERLLQSKKPLRLGNLNVI